MLGKDVMTQEARLPLPACQVARELEMRTGLGSCACLLALSPVHRGRLLRGELDTINTAHKALYGVPLPGMEPYRPNPEHRITIRHPEVYALAKERG